MTEETSNAPDSAEPSLTELGRALFTEARSPIRIPGHSWLPPAPEELQAQLPQCEILDMIGRGGMGAVYLASQSALDRLVAIKILSTELDALDPGFSQRFQNEARAMARLSHPGIVAIHEFGETPSGLHYIVMEFIEGTNVQQMITASRRLHTEHALAITAHVCDALHYAHERGIIHRDIKPANIIVGYDGNVKVADFGLAKVGVAGEARQFTQSGTTLGTPHYIAPESLIPGAQTDRRADIYATGVMLYHMLTGKMPQGLFELPSIQVPGLDPRLDGIIARALREDRDQRYPTAAALRAALDGILTQRISPTGQDASLPHEARPQRPGSRTQGQTQMPLTLRPQAHAGSNKVPIRKWAVVPALAFSIFGGWFYFRADPPANRITSPPLAATPARPLPVQATKDQPFVNTLGMKFVPVPGTDVLFCIHETRYSDYAAFARETPGMDDIWKDQTSGYPRITERVEDHPVRLITWEDVHTFRTWLSRKEGMRYRLPTDREWSVAVGIGHTEEWGAETTSATVFKDPNLFPWGTAWPPPPGAGNFSDQSRKTLPHPIISGEIEDYHDGYPTTAPVMSYAPNSHGLYDMSGNVWEMVLDWFDSTKTRRTVRGGSYAIFERSMLLSSHRNILTPESTRGNGLGFRLVLELLQAPRTPTKSSQARLEESPVPSALAHAPLSLASKDQPFVNTLGMKFVPVPDTKILMCVHETRQRDYAAFWSIKPTGNDDWRQPFPPGFDLPHKEEHPVSKISWFDAISFTDWLTEKEGLKYRLPTDAEWSAGVGSDAFPWGNDWPPVKPVGNYKDESTIGKISEIGDPAIQGYNDHFILTSPVMSFPANHLGLHDMGGNVWEWCMTSSPSNPGAKILRGAAWNRSLSNYLFSMARTDYASAGRFNVYGFRVVIELAESTPATSSEAATSAPTLPLPPAAIDQPFVNTLGMKFVPVPGTDTLFCIHETRRQDYTVFAIENPSAAVEWRASHAPRSDISELDAHPVASVNGYDARAFCAWLSQKENRLYRLPTDREWSLAVGIGAGEEWGPSTPPTTVNRVADTYPWGREWPPLLGAGNYSDESRVKTASPDIDGAVPGGYRDGFPFTAPVMSFQPNKLGLYDLGGNVWEIVHDWSGLSKDRYVARGACFRDYARSTLLASYRAFILPEVRRPEFGFRIVLASSEPAPPAQADTPGGPASPAAPGSAPAFFRNSLTMVFLPVPGTKVLFSIYETRWMDYAAFAAETPGLDPSWKDQSFRGIALEDLARFHPVIGVSWLEADQFCQWLTAKERALGRIGPQDRYRLPTDAEWSYAAGIGDQEDASLLPVEKLNKVEAYPWPGGRYPPGPGDGNFADRSAMKAASSGHNALKYFQHFDDGYPTTAPVGRFRPNALGLFDLAGNVMEWCQDEYDKNQRHRVIRGTAWMQGESSLHTMSSFRGRNLPTFRTPYLGFRVVLVRAED